MAGCDNKSACSNPRPAHFIFLETSLSVILVPSLHGLALVDARNKSLSISVNLITKHWILCREKFLFLNQA